MKVYGKLFQRTCRTFSNGDGYKPRSRSLGFRVQGPMWAALEESRNDLKREIPVIPMFLAYRPRVLRTPWLEKNIILVIALMIISILLPYTIPYKLL